MKVLKVLSCICITALLSACGNKDPSDNYLEITSPESSADITMFFWYRCPACYMAEKELSEWASDKDIDIEFRHSAIWENDAKLFYTLDLLGLTEEYQSGLMEYFRHSSNPNLKGVVDVIDNRYDESHILRRLDSHHVRNRITATRSYESHVGSSGVPLIVVKNRYALVGDGLRSGNIGKTIEHIMSLD